jgi:preprotein translocase subunit SecG
MTPVLIAGFWTGLAKYFFGISLFCTAIFLILLILVQRGRGGGLTGALGGMGGQSAFGTKAGDLFTRITVVAAIIWITLCMLAVIVLNAPTSGRFGESESGPPAVAPVLPGDDAEPESGDGESD